MMSFGGLFQQDLLELILLGAPFTPPSEFWVSLHTGDPGTDGANEVAVGRQQVTFAGPVTIDNAVLSSTEVHFASTPGGNISHLGLWNAATGGKFLYGGTLSAMRPLLVNEGIRFYAGSIRVRHGEIVA